jgi:hypothetical protein
MMNKVCSIFSLANLPLPLAREGGLLLIFSWATLSIVKGASTAGMAAVFSILVNSMSSLSGENRLQVGIMILVKHLALDERLRIFTIACRPAWIWAVLLPSF